MQLFNYFRYKKDLVEECISSMRDFVYTLGQALEINQALIKPDQVRIIL